MKSNITKKYLYFWIISCLLLINAPSGFAAETTLSWTAPLTNSDNTSLTDLDGYIVYYGISSENYTKSINVGNVTTYKVSGLTIGTTYYFAVKAYDTSGNKSIYSNELQKTIVDTTPPVATPVFATETTPDYIYSSGLVGYWKFDEGTGTTAADSSGNGNDGVINGAVWANGITGGALVFDGLDDYVQIGTGNINTDSGTLSLWVNSADFIDTQYIFGHTTTPAYQERLQLYIDDTAGNLDLGLGNTHIAATGIQDLETNTWYHFAIVWNGNSFNVYVDGSLTASGQYAGFSNLHTFADIGNDGNLDSRSSGWDGLIDEVRIYNRALNAVEISDLYSAIPQDSTPPSVSGVATANITDSSASVSWTTDEAADTQVQYGTTTSYGSSTTINSALSTSHSRNISGLSASTLYHYRVLSRDAAGNLATSGDYTFTTSAPPDTTTPVISSVQSLNITDSSASVSWTTDEAADTQVQYGTTTSYGSSTTINSALSTSHIRNISGLSASTLYHYRVLSRDAAGNLATSRDYTFTTSAPPDTTTPVISSVQSLNITDSSASVGWTTDEAADTQVQYGTTTSYGSSTTLNSALSTSHSRNISGLSASTLYHYRVLSRDAAGNLAASGDVTFTTQDAVDDTTFTTQEAPITTASTIQVSNVILSEDFSAGIPAAWSALGAWDTDNTCGQTIEYPFVKPFAMVDSACDETSDDLLVTESFDTISCSSVELTFSNQYFRYSGNIEIDVSSDGGITWSNNLYIDSNDGYPTPAWKDVDISAITESEDALVRFRYLNSTSNGFWALDNVWVTCRSAETEFTSIVSSSSTRTIMITNSGEDNLTIDAIEITGTDTPDFTLENDDCSGQTLSPAESCALDVVFSPSSSGLKSADLSISSNDPENPTSIQPLSGTGTPGTPVPRIKANGSTGYIELRRREELVITIELDPGNFDGEVADWWVLMEHRNRLYYYDAQNKKWRRGSATYHQGALSSTGPIVVKDKTRSKTGLFTYYFGVDTVMNGFKDSDTYFVDSVTVNVK